MKLKIPILNLVFVILITSCSSNSGGNDGQTLPGTISVTCTPPICAQGETVSCADECYGDCGLACASLTPTPPPAATPSPTPSYEINLMAVGDIMLARTIGERVLSEGPEIVFAGVQSIFDTADVLAGNLECAITDTGEPQPKYYTFAAPPEASQSLGLAGFDLLTLANNHVLDYGIEGLRDTWTHLGQAGISHVGTGINASQARSPVILEHDGLRIAFLAYVDVPIEVRTGFDTRAWRATDAKPGLAWADPALMTLDISAALSQADLVVVLLHAGWEGVNAIIEYQQRLARAAIDAGATLVIGAHTHVLQPAEWYKGGLIAYSLGNFVFDDLNENESRSTILRVVLTRDGVQGYEWIPVIIEDGLPRLASAEEAPAILDFVGP